MRPYILISVFLVSLSTFASIQKQSFRFHSHLESASLFLGLPSGLRYKNWTGSKNAVGYDLGLHTVDDVVQAQINYFIYSYEAKDKWKRNNFWNNAFFYFGPGALVGFGLDSASSKNDTQIGVRAFSGMEYLFANSKWGYTIELGGVVFLRGKETFNAQAFVGLNYYWNRSRAKYFRKNRTKKGTSNENDSEFNDFFEEEQPSGSEKTDSDKEFDNF